MSNYIYDKKALISDEDIENLMDEVRQEYLEVPDYVFDCHTIRGKKMGKTKQQFFVEEEKSLANRQLSLFDNLKL